MLSIYLFLFDRYHFITTTYTAQTENNPFLKEYWEYDDETD